MAELQQQNETKIEFNGKHLIITQYGNNEENDDIILISTDYLEMFISAIKNEISKDQSL
jgi:hypothetical protein